MKQDDNIVECVSKIEQTHDDVNHERRDVLRAFAKYSGAVGVTSFAVLTADEAVANQPCSTHPQPQPGKNCGSGS